MRTLSSCDPKWLEGNVVLVRVDINVPFKDGKIIDDSRLVAIKPTVDFLLKSGCNVRLLAHLGRPKGKINQDLSLEKIIPNLELVLGHTVTFKKQFEPATEQLVLYENVRFFAEEESNNSAFAKKLARLGDVFVNDAFSVSHRAHASVTGITEYLPSYAGLSLSQEIDTLRGLLSDPARPLVAIVGGSKISTKIHLVEALLKKCDKVFLGGGLANTFLMAAGKNVAKSLVEKDQIAWAKGIIQGYDNLILPLDSVVARDIGATNGSRLETDFDLQADEAIFDVGPRSCARLSDLFAEGGTVVWNGPLGAFEYPPFHEGTVEVLKQLSAATRMGHVKSIIGGGETVAATKMIEQPASFSFISTAGGAFLEWLEGKNLPGLEVLQENQLKESRSHL